MAVTASDLATRPWSVVTSGFWVQGIGLYVTFTLLLLLAGIPLERRLGSLRFAIAAAATQIPGILGAAGFVWAARGLMGTWSADLVTHLYLGPSAALFGVAMAATPTMSTLWRRRLRVTTFVLLLLLALYDGSFPDLVRFAAAVIGLGLGPILYRRSPRPAFPSMSRREARVLFALSLSAFAVGPVIAGLAPHSAGPLSVLRYLFTDIQPVDPQTLQSVCTDLAQANDCAMMRLQLRAGAGGIFMSILPSVMLLLCADGLRRGRRFAWGATVVVLGAMGVLAGTHIAALLFPALAGTVQEETMGGLDLTQFRHPWSLVLPLLLPMLLLLLVLASRRLFAVSAPPGTYRQLGLRLLAGGSVLAVIYIVAGLFLAGGFTPVPGLLQLAADVPDRFLPLGYTLDIPPTFFPQSTPAVLLYEGTGVAFWTLAAVLILFSFLKPVHSRNADDLNRARRILMTQEGSSLSWMTTWLGNTYWFSATGNAFVA
ncbi:MAG: rhomboid family intramembrane serine protease, partial [Actinomycetota bacterium]|nr:rhomboid family intramembrane serine protease [Actinomycetota bacterium]